MGRIVEIFEGVAHRIFGLGSGKGTHICAIAMMSIVVIGVVAMLSIVAISR